MLGVLLYLNSIAGVPHLLCFLPTIYALFFRSDLIKYNIYNNRIFLSIFFMFLIGAMLNNAFNGFTAISNVYLNIPTLLCAFALKKEDLRYFIVFVFVESFIAFYEYKLGISSILPGAGTEFVDSDYFYFKRVSGISKGSSTFAAKIFFSVMFLLFIKRIFTKKNSYIILTILLFALFTTFNRTYLIVCFLLLCIYLYYRYKSLLLKNIGVSFILVIVIAAVLIILYNAYFNEIFSQFTRGNTDTALTGRPEIWNKFFHFIKDNFFFGNGSVRLLVPRDIDVIHAHNSFIQLLADHGIVLSLLLLINIVIRMNRRNMFFCLFFFFASLTQYTIFWGFSIADVFFYAVLCNEYIYKALSLKSNVCLK